MLDPHLFLSLIDRVEAAVSQAGGRLNIDQWICQNTMDPRKKGQFWSFKGHEFQRAIVTSQAPRTVVQKCAQRGISEIMVRLALALLAKLSGEHAIYVLPTTRFASKFSSSRVDPVVEASPRLRSMVSKNVNSTEIKQVGSSFLHIGGAQREGQAISIPARILIRDEYSFGNPDILSIYQSRLEHNPEQDRIVVDFSTPLYPKMGITEAYEQGTMFVYMAYHDKCGQWVVVDSLQGIRIPGFDKPLIELDMEDFNNSRYNFPEAFFQCPHCHNPISQENLADPDKRAWVGHFPERPVHSYHVDPLCMASISTAADVVSSLRIYRKVGRWVQFAMGQPYESAETQIMESAIEKACVLQNTNDRTYNAVAGMDVGKISHLCNGVALDKKLHIINMELIQSGGDNNLGEIFMQRYKKYHCIKGVVDNAPDVELTKYIVSRLRYGDAYGAYFVRKIVGLEWYVANELDGTVRVSRTSALDEFVKTFNSGGILLPRSARDNHEVREQLTNPKRITLEDQLGDESAVWHSKGADHWFFSLFYCWLASKMAAEGGVMPTITPSSLVSTVRLKQTA